MIKQFGLENFIKEIAEMPPQESIEVLVEMLFNLLMKKERDFFVEADSDNKSNGFYQRHLGCMFENLNLSVPRDRQRRFRSQSATTSLECSKPMAVSRGVLYELQQMFQMRFAHETKNS